MNASVRLHRCTASISKELIDVALQVLSPCGSVRFNIAFPVRFGFGDTFQQTTTSADGAFAFSSNFNVETNEEGNAFLLSRVRLCFWYIWHVNITLRVRLSKTVAHCQQARTLLCARRTLISNYSLQLCPCKDALISHVAFKFRALVSYTGKGNKCSHSHYLGEQLQFWPDISQPWPLLRVQNPWCPPQVYFANWFQQTTYIVRYCLQRS